MGLPPGSKPILLNFARAWLSRAVTLIGLAVRDGKITEIDILADPERLSRLNLAGVIS
jgi:hypothetical protein